MKLAHSGAIAAVLLVSCGQGVAAACLQAERPGQFAVGMLEHRISHDAARRPEPTFILVPPAPICLDGTDPADQIKSAVTVHVFSSREPVMDLIGQFVGSMVLIRGSAFGSRTVHHHAPIVIDVSEIQLKSAADQPAARTGMIVDATGNPNPSYSKATTPSPMELIETWRASNKFIPGKKVDRERFEILDHRIVWGRQGRALLQFRILAASGDAMDFAANRCRGRTTPVELQIYFQFSRDLGAWVPQGARGENTDNLCSNDSLWTAAQIQTLVDPPPLPVPPKVAQREVYTPKPGTRERAEIMDALRPRYQELFGKPIVFRVDQLRIAAGFVFAVVHPQRPNGSHIEQRAWDRVMGSGCFHTRESVAHEYWMQRKNGQWTIGLKNDMCADDSIVDQGDLIGAPPQLVGREAWPEREFMPEPR